MFEGALSTMAIGRLLRSSTTGFVFGCSVTEPDVPRFGDFVKAPAQRGRTNVLGLIYDIVIEDDPFVRRDHSFHFAFQTRRVLQREPPVALNHRGVFQLVRRQLQMRRRRAGCLR